MNFNFEYKFGNSDLGNQVSKFVEIEVGCFDPVKVALIDIAKHLRIHNQN